MNMNVECACGQVTHFVEINGIVCRDMNAHGNCAASYSCVNCNMPFDLPETKPHPVTDPAEPAIDYDKAFDKMKVAELRAACEAKGLSSDGIRAELIERLKKAEDDDEESDEPEE